MTRNTEISRARQSQTYVGVLLAGLSLLAGCGGGGGGGSASGSVCCAAGPTPTPKPLPTPTPVSTPTPIPVTGTVTIVVPTPAPVICSPSPVVVAVSVRTVVDCTAAGYIGTFAITVADPSVASVTLAPGTTTFYNVTGLKAGSTTLSLTFPPTGSGSVVINVTP